MFWLDLLFVKTAFRPAMSPSMNSSKLGCPRWQPEELWSLMRSSRWLIVAESYSLMLFLGTVRTRENRSSGGEGRDRLAPRRVQCLHQNFKFSRPGSLSELHKKQTFSINTFISFRKIYQSLFGHSFWSIHFLESRSFTNPGLHSQRATHISMQVCERSLFWSVSSQKHTGFGSSQVGSQAEPHELYISFCPHPSEEALCERATRKTRKKKRSFWEEIRIRFGVRGENAPCLRV